MVHSSQVVADELVQQIVGTPHELAPVQDAELDSDDKEASEQPHEPNEDVPAQVTVEKDEPQAPRRVRITMKDLKRHGFTGGCPRCADLEYGRMNSRKNHSEECRACMYNKFEDEKHDQYLKVRAGILRARREHLPMPNFVHLDAADY